MSIGIVTFHRANNLGAVLQAYALTEYINGKNLKAEVIDYYPNNDIPSENSLIHSVLHLGKQVLTFPKSVKENKKNKKFNDFRKKYIPISEKHYYGDSVVLKEPPKYETYISGSDQILNTALTGTSKAYYLSFVKSGKRISYASSFGRESISNDEKELIKSELTKFDACSFRESSGMKLAKDIAGINGALVLDPVFLLDKEKWESIADNRADLPSKYVFVYAMEQSNKMKEVCEKLRAKTDLPIILVNGGGTSLNIKAKKDKTCGPCDFLRYIKNAEYVVTNSFHGTAFSLIFEKKLLCIAHSTRNTRLENILALAMVTDKMIGSESVISNIENNVIDGAAEKENINCMIERSKEYLSKLL